MTTKNEISDTLPRTTEPMSKKWKFFIYGCDLYAITRQGNIVLYQQDVYATKEGNTAYKC